MRAHMPEWERGSADENTEDEMITESGILQGALVLSRSGKQKGRTTGGTRPCGMAECAGTLVRVQWDNGKVTWPCDDALSTAGNGVWQVN